MTPLVRTLVLAAVLAVSVYGPAAAQQEREEQIGRFYVRLGVDPITDRERSSVIVPSNAGTDRLVAMSIQCRDRELRVLVMGDGFLGTEPTIDVEWRFDAEPARSGEWDVAGDAQSVFVPSDQVPSFVAATAKAERVVVRLHSRLGRQFTHIFPTKGISAALERLGCARPYLATNVAGK